MIDKKNNDKFINPNIILFKKYKAIKYINNGAYSKVYKGINISSGLNVAIKVESKEYNFLESEAYTLYTLKGKGIPKLYSFGKIKDYKILIEELLGKSLYDVYIKKKFSNAEICIIILQLIERLEYIHSKNYIHRDLKPQNILYGITEPNLLYLVDFGCAFKYRSSKTGKHLPFIKTHIFTGSADFASFYMSEGIKSTRRDDLISLGYIIIYLFKGKLPWSSIKFTNIETFLEKIYIIKKEIPIEKLCENLDENIFKFMSYTYLLKFDQDPNYNYLNGLIKELYTKYLKITKPIPEKKNNNFILYNIYTNIKTERKNSPQMRLYKKIKDSLTASNININEKSINNKTVKERASTSSTNKNYRIKNKNKPTSKDYIKIINSNNILTNKKIKNIKFLSNTNIRKRSKKIIRLDLISKTNSEEKIQKDFDESEKNIKKSSMIIKKKNDSEISFNRKRTSHLFSNINIVTNTEVNCDYKDKKRFINNELTNYKLKRIKLIKNKII